MHNYRISLEVEGAVSRQVIEFEDKGWQRWKALDSLVAQRMQRLKVLPNTLLFASTDGDRPALSGLFKQHSLLNGLSDLWNALVKQPIDSSCFVQIVDQAPGRDDSARMALEKSLARVSPFSLDAFEELLEVQEQVYDTRIFSGVLLDRHGRLNFRDESTFFKKRVQRLKSSTFIDAVVRETEEPGKTKNLRGRDVRVQDFRSGLQGIGDLFGQWDEWLKVNARIGFPYQRIIVYSHLKGLLPACWEQLQKRGVSAEAVRLPQWIAYSNGIAAYMEFLVAEVESCAFIFVGINGNCHFAEWLR